MLHKLTWGEFALVLFILNALYYGALALKYYGGSLVDRKPVTQELQRSLFEAPAPAMDIDPEVDEIDTLIAELKKAGTIPGYQAILQAHSGLSHSMNRPAINELLASECEKHQLKATEEEIDGWWK